MANSLINLSTRILRSARTRLRGMFRTRRSFALPMEGVTFLLVTLLIGGAAMNTATQLLFLVFSMMCSFWILSAFLATSSLRGLTLTRLAPRSAVARRPVRVRVRIRNGKRLTGSFSLRVSDTMEDGTVIGAAFFPMVRRRDHAESQYECLFPRRGIFRFKKLTIATRFPFALIERTLSTDDPQEILVLPPVISVEGLLRKARVDLGDVEAHMKGRGVGLYGIRPYQQGESARDIHWKISARTGNLMVREYESDERRRASILLDNRLAADAAMQEREELERGIVLASSLISYLLENGHQVELLTASGKVPFGQGAPHLMRCRRALALLTPEPLTAPPPHAHVPEADSVQIEVLYGFQEATHPEAAAIHARDARNELTMALAGVDEPIVDDRPGAQPEGMESLLDLEAAAAVNATPMPTRRKRREHGRGAGHS